MLRGSAFEPHTVVCVVVVLIDRFVVFLSVNTVLVESSTNLLPGIQPTAFAVGEYFALWQNL